MKLTEMVFKRHGRLYEELIMKTEQIRLIQDTYTVPAEVGGYLVTCPGCGARIKFTASQKCTKSAVFASKNRK